MYEMYPEAWTVTEPQRSDGDKPRRRTRKEHSVLPAVIAHQAETGLELPQGAAVRTVPTSL